MFKKMFSPNARRVLQRAQEEAQRFNHNYIATEHILLGLVRESDCVAARVLANVGVDLAKIRSAMEFLTYHAEKASQGEVGLTPRAKKIIELAEDEARRMSHTYIGTEHLLIGLLREGEGVAAGLLESLGATLDKVHAELDHILHISATRRVVLADGNFDGLHFGHIAHLRDAKKLGDTLVVALATDDAVAAQKGPGRPRFPYEERHAMLKELRCVDRVEPCDDSVRLIEKLRPDVLVKGPDYKVGDHPSHARQIQTVESYGGRVVYTDAPAASSSKLLNDKLPLEGMIGEYANKLRVTYKYEDVMSWLDKAHALNATLLGERIIDEYRFAEPEGKSPKEEVITYRFTHADTYPGGVDIIKSHLQEACHVSALVTSAQTVRKVRYVSLPFNRKVFSTVASPCEVDPLFLSDAQFQGSDLVVVADFGHGLVRGKTGAKRIALSAPWLAVTVQSNSLNWGFNLLNKWQKADYFVLDEMELRLTTIDRYTVLEDLLAAEVARLKASCGVVTMGHKGVLIYDGREFHRAPALATKVVDRMGAGDAFFAWSAPLAKAGAPMEILGLVGSVAAGIKVGELGNTPVRRRPVEKWLKSLLA